MEQNMSFSLSDAANTGFGVIHDAQTIFSDNASIMDRINSAASIGLGIKGLFSDDSQGANWRVRLSVPETFKSSPIFKPFDDNGLVFPYTPTIKVSGGANYTPLPLTHMNYQFQMYKNSSVGDITINAPMNVETQEEAKYWIAMLHYFRTMTKMFVGNEGDAGNPPPLVKLNGYGTGIFSNVLVAVKSYDVSLEGDCDYIPANVQVGSLSELSALAGDVSNAIGTAGDMLGISDVTDVVQQGIGAAQGLAGIASKFIRFPSGGDVTMVPTKSTFNVTLLPMYSRRKMISYTLNDFAQGGLLKRGYL